jgi:hypothetical protein
LGRESRKLGITEDELCKQIADEAKHRREEREKNCPLADPT